MKLSDQKQQFKNYLKEIDYYREALSLIHWDMRTKIPTKGVEQRSEVAGFLGEKIHQLQTSKQMEAYIKELKPNTDDSILLRTIEVCEEEYERNKKIPHKLYKDFMITQTKSEAIWQQAKENDDFHLFRPYLKKLVDFNREFASYWGYENNIYDALLHKFEPGITVNELDHVFPKLRSSLRSTLEKVQTSAVKPDPSIIQVHFPKQQQVAFTEQLLKQMGYDFTSGRLDETVHPFAIPLNQNDVRLTTRYNENDFRMAVFGTIHEGGHGLYEQNIDPRLARTPLATGASMGIHESQSLFWENFIARSYPFWEKNYDLFLQYAPHSFQNVDLEQFYQTINEVKPSFIRIEADELTYPLHIMIRYELEKALINEEIIVDDLPHLWNEKMNNYLGITPPTDREGVLQDIHWAGGDFGYFPSYALGYMYAAQIYHTLSKDLPVESLIRTGDLTPIKSWLAKSIHQYGKLKEPLEILTDVTNETLNPDYLVQHLEKKFKAIYQF
ncbi:carboxypeptidase M32 [Virgibacillus dokdonensis]|uniref:Metal-dependent carboxypeptidase n=1 Tax=Virgibacillus dokdonensis TaxID=302167 RepID=A0A3E0WZF4_9BACI|nr:carboxypeptidase M32 [Virgibacillus dokdonensis]RFA37277.1 carboxypeptidase M32 [Virgibacillus dokdonensis]